MAGVALSLIPGEALAVATMAFIGKLLEHDAAMVASMDAEQKQKYMETWIATRVRANEFAQRVHDLFGSIGGAK